MPQKSGRLYEDDILEVNFIELNSLCFDQNIIEICSWEPHWPYVITGTTNGLEANRHHAITWTTKFEQDMCRHMASRGQKS